MLLKNYEIEMFRPKCNANFQSLHCHAHLAEDIGEAIPYLNGVLGGMGFTRSPPSVMFKIHGRLIAVHPRRISINALKDAAEAEKIVEWLKREINDAWDKRNEIEPSYQGMPKPKIIEILKLLPQTNCRECGASTCMVFATKVAEGVKGSIDCPQMNDEQSKKLSEYITAFNLTN